jgi:hypothetical protein
MILDGKLLSYHYQLEKNLLPPLADEGGKKKRARKRLSMIKRRIVKERTMHVN